MHKVHTPIGGRTDGRTDGRNDEKPKTMSLRFSSKRRGTIKLIKDSERINEKGDGSNRGYGYLSLVRGPLDLITWSQR